MNSKSHHIISSTHKFFDENAKSWQHWYTEVISVSAKCQQDKSKFLSLNNLSVAFFLHALRSSLSLSGNFVFCHMAHSPHIEVRLEEQLWKPVGGQSIKEKADFPAFGPRKVSESLEPLASKTNGKWPRLSRVQGLRNCGGARCLRFAGKRKPVWSYVWYQLSVSLIFCLRVQVHMFIPIL